MNIERKLFLGFFGCVIAAGAWAVVPSTSASPALMDMEP